MTDRPPSLRHALAPSPATSRRIAARALAEHRKAPSAIRWLLPAAAGLLTAALTGLFLAHTGLQTRAAVTTVRRQAGFILVESPDGRRATLQPGSTRPRKTYSTEGGVP